MNNYILVGKIINTFGIKGELKINSDFEYKDRVFVKDFNIYIGEEKVKEIINTHRIHKNYDMVLFNGYSNINEVLKYKGKNIYIKRDDLILNDNEVLLSDLIGYKVIDNNQEIGVVIDYESNINNVLLKVMGSKTFYIPYIDEYVIKIDKDSKEIITNNGGSLIL